ncbi:MAG: hypothetical protein OXG58_01080 [Gemmatimonadetes bacterium]|nr:hypothetical protein [Gemmatimonadota bacterium]MCY3943286.1 hypothetical protein [Gemmatimonadota bacterium]
MTGGGRRHGAHDPSAPGCGLRRWVDRIRHTLMDFGPCRCSGLLKVPSYGAALAASLWAALVLWGIPG